ncbi:MAG: transglycosylase SLT domain-containing protein [Alphaproteobacteria bacterium]|nr:transglycosylase SLT domain-containing protein [Alphaproteobacteria bacterium]
MKSLFLSTLAPAVSIESSFRQASVQTGIGFDFLLRTAERESGLKPDAKSGTSSALGLFQFVEQTWLDVMKEDGLRFGLGNLSSQILQHPSGDFFVDDPVVRRRIMDLRSDPLVSSLMAGALAERNASVLEIKLERNPNPGELYIAHFLGASGCVRLIKTINQSPGISADILFPHAADANFDVFYKKDGQARSAEQVYDFLVSSHENTRKTVFLYETAGNLESRKFASGTGLSPEDIKMVRSHETPAVPFSWIWPTTGLSPYLPLERKINQNAAHALYTTQMKAE